MKKIVIVLIVIVLLSFFSPQIRHAATQVVFCEVSGVSL